MQNIAKNETSVINKTILLTKTLIDRRKLDISIKKI